MAPLAAQVVPVNLPAPDNQPVDKTKPVKVFILSGQSNALGFGKVAGSSPLYSSIFLSADPSVKACKMPVDNGALLPLGIFVSKQGSEKGGTAHLVDGHVKLSKEAVEPTDIKASHVEKFALGQVTATLPTTDQPHTLSVSAYLEVPYDGTYETHSGMGASSQCIAWINHQKVYQKLSDKEDAVITQIALKAGVRYPLTVRYVGTGGSATFWMEQVGLEGKGDLKWVVEKLGRFPYMQDAKGKWSVRNDVMLNDAYMGKGKSAPLSAPACGPTFGPELGFGYVLGTYLDEPVIVMKADIGNRSLGWDILPPGSVSYTHEGKTYPGYGETLGSDGKVKKPGPKDWYAGKQYDDYTAAIHNVLDNFDKHYPQYADQGFEVAGFFWWQGHKDGPNAAHNSRYEQNLANLIKAWRKEFNAPNAKWTIATVGFDGENMPEHYVKIAQAQMNVADPQLHPEFAGTVKTIDTRPFWRGPEVSPKNQNYHYNHNAETYMLTGDALGRAMVELLGGKADYPSAVASNKNAGAPFMKPPSGEELARLASALKPIMLDQLIPAYIATADSIPTYRRGGMELKAIIANKAPEETPRKGLASQLDQVIGYYNVAGIDDYNWKPFGPDMQKAQWHYHSFDPKEKMTRNAKGKVGDMYRDVTLPTGMENWHSADFDPTQAGWKQGAAPFGMNDGKQAALIAGCQVAHCGCHLTPSTLWEKEVLLMRQSFEVPDFKLGHRYRIIVGGAGHGWSGEGYALYLNGKLISEAKGGYYKGGGAARGAYVFEDLMPEFKKGKATFAVKAFLRRTGHRGKLASPRGHISVWIQEAKLPPVVTDMTTATEK
ncbi:MAG: hypothetical protein KJO21_12835 [Verrucomicrobiae bacterium]|nr:hypothetical protein [Verrucomicrobiae bacterium]NNJ44243.1 hypothetical protein [Akkermansiaceae bacterium]